MGKIDKAEWGDIGRAALAILPRVVVALIDGRLSRDEAAALLPEVERLYLAIRDAAQD